MSTYTGPTKIDCPQQCDVPANIELSEVPPPRHNWSDVLRCPNGEGCERWFLVTDNRQTASEVTT